MIRLENIQKKIGAKNVLNGVSFSIPRNKIVSLCGPNGAGKTTIIRIILDLVKPDAGAVDYSIPFDKISFVFHNPCLFDDLTLKENIDFFSRLKGISIDKKYLETCLILLSLENDFKNKISTYSKGMVQKADLLRSLIEKPSVLILDEPTAHLDPEGKVEIRKILKDCVREYGISILLTSHLLNEVQKLTDTVIFIAKGKIKLESDINLLVSGNCDLEEKYLEIIKGEINSNER
jgi:ABC-2 type transport system ATP-binding protein